MRIHHLNCISTCPLGGRLMDGRTEGLRARLTCHALLVELPDQLVLIDTGFGLNDVRRPRPRLSSIFLFLMAPDFREEMTAIRQIERLGYDPQDVRHIVLTHLDFDHAGGLDDFPRARVHLLEHEETSAVAQRTMLDRMRYRPMQWGDRTRWNAYQGGEGEHWFGFDAVRHMTGLPPEILLVPLVGHTLGHCGVAIDRGDRWLLDAGDAYFFHDEMDLTNPRCTPGLRAYQWMMDKNGEARRWNQDRLRILLREQPDRVTVFSSHDEVEFERLSGRSARVPADPLPPRSTQRPDDGMSTWH
jgi:glyoxylase-like metal-dependent hydrolase (beta-lactamase superfamily II)